MKTTNRSRILRSKKVPFTMVPNEVLQSQTLSLRARGLFAYMMSFPEDWVFYKSELHKNLPEGRDAVRAAFDELVGMGWIVVTERKTHNGQFTYTYELNVSQTDVSRPEMPDAEEVDTSPVTGNPSTVNLQPVTGNPSTVNLQPVTGNPSTVNQTLPNTIITNTINTNDQGAKNDLSEDTKRYHERIDRFHEQCINDTAWIEIFCMQTGLDVDQAMDYLKKFLTYCKATEEPLMSIKDYRRFATHKVSKLIADNVKTVKTMHGSGSESMPGQRITAAKPSKAHRN